MPSPGRGLSGPPVHLQVSGVKTGVYLTVPDKFADSMLQRPTSISENGLVQLVAVQSYQYASSHMITPKLTQVHI
jgi:hypothetical protein